MTSVVGLMGLVRPVVGAPLVVEEALRAAEAAGSARAEREGLADEGVGAGEGELHGVDRVAGPGGVRGDEDVLEGLGRGPEKLVNAIVVLGFVGVGDAGGRGAVEAEPLVREALRRRSDPQPTVKVSSAQPAWSAPALSLRIELA